MLRVENGTCEGMWFDSEVRIRKRLEGVRIETSCLMDGMLIIAYDSISSVVVNMMLCVVEVMIQWRRCER